MTSNQRQLPPPNSKSLLLQLTKDDILYWFRNNTGSVRIDTLSGILESCLPFEIRYIGAIVEILKKKESPALKEMAATANAVVVQQKQMSRNHSPTSNTNVAAGLPLPQPPPQPAPPTPLLNGTTTSKGSSVKSNSSSEDDSSVSGVNDVAETGNTVVQSSAAPTIQSKDTFVLDNESTRQKLIIYISLLLPDNQDAAKVYYSLLSQVEDTVGNATWLEGLDETILDEVILLYTLAIHHPAFPYEQRLMLSGILQKLRAQLIRNKVSKSVPSFFQPVQVYDSQYGHYFIQHLPNMPAQVHPVPPVEHQVTSSTPSSQHPTPTNSGLQGPVPILASAIQQHPPTPTTSGLQGPVPILASAIQQHPPPPITSGLLQGPVPILASSIQNPKDASILGHQQHQLSFYK